MRIRDMGWKKFWTGMKKSRIRDGKKSNPGWKKVGSGIRDKHPGSATLGEVLCGPVRRESEPAWCWGPILSTSSCSATSCNTHIQHCFICRPCAGDRSCPPPAVQPPPVILTFFWIPEYIIYFMYTGSVYSNCVIHIQLSRTGASGIITWPLGHTRLLSLPPTPAIYCIIHSTCTRALDSCPCTGYYIVILSYNSYYLSS